MSHAGELFIGLMSGTSVDGIDAALVEFDSDKKLRVVCTQFTPFADPLREQINALALADDKLRRCEDSVLHHTLADLYAKASLALIDKAQVPKQLIAGIANHGQTVRHEPRATPAFSLQLGDPQRIADISGIDTYAQFRQADLAVGGQGAPLMPAFHQALFGNGEQRFVLNIGGIANISQLGATVVGFDTGPGNTLLDQWIHHHRGLAFDQSGEWARQGRVISAVLEKCLADPYFSRVAPKSTGPDYFNLGWLQTILHRVNNGVDDYRPEDVQATLLALTVASIADDLKRLCGAGGSVYVCGGGADNAAMMDDLKNRLSGFSIANTDALGVPSEWVEAVGFAWLGYCCKHAIKSNLPSVTGASKQVVLGEKYTPSSVAAG